MTSAKFEGGWVAGGSKEDNFTPKKNQQADKFATEIF